MKHRTLEEYKEEVFDKLDEQTKLEWLYEMSEKLCNIEEYIKKAMTDKSIFEITIEEKDKEIERLNNIINELEKWLIDEYSKYNGAIRITNVLDKLRQLKEGK